MRNSVEMAKRYVVLCFTFTFLWAVCLADLTFRVNEEKPSGTFVGNISDSSDLQTLLSEEVLGSLKYSFLVQGYPHSALFLIVNNTGKIFTSQVLDREALCGFSDSCVLNLEVAVQSTISQFFRKEKVNVILNDVNDNRPEYSSSSVQVDISESVSVNSSYQLEAAVDRDIGNNSLKGYRLVSDSDVFSLKTVQTLDGGSVVSLVVSKLLDREKRDRYNVTVIAHDGGSPPMSSSLLVNIKIKDVNDNSPVFSSPAYNISVNEISAIGSIVVTLSATDADTSANGVALYRFSPLLRGDITKYFSINSSNGDVTVRSPLDLVQGKTMEGVVECIDHGSPPLIAQTLLTINIADTTNDRPSINLNLLADGKVSEYAQPGTTVAHVAVLDPDTGRNGIVRCLLQSKVFELQGLDVDEYKIIVAKGIDRETDSSFNVTLTCVDAGEPPLNRSVSFNVQVKDENDNDPLFSKSVYRGNITENNMIGEVVLKVSASDIDTGLNGQIKFSSLDGDKLGVTVNNNGQIITKRKFDRERDSKLTFKVFASDNGSPQRNSTATVQINILDVNDVSPAFTTSTYVFGILENKAPNSLVDIVKANDGDTGVNGEILYSIFQDDEIENILPFVINSKGEIHSTMQLDRELKRRYEFVVVATDGGEPSLHGSATVIIDVKDVNDNKPIIMAPSGLNNSVALPYTTPENALVVAVSARDADFEDNGDVSYLLAPGTPGQNLFQVGSRNGLLKTKRELKIEDVGSYNLVVLATDGGVPPLVANVSIEVGVFSSNETTAASQSEENALVVIILGTLTGVITVAVIITIVIIRRMDSKKKHEQEVNHSIANSSRLGSEDILKLGGSTYLSKNGDLSFDSIHSNTSVNGSNDSEDKLLKEKKSEVEDKSRQLSSISGGKLVSFGPNEEWPTAVKLHKDLLKLHHIEFKDSNLAVKRSDDTNSDSSGEITGTDSGRGGSEEDSHSNGRASPPVPPAIPKRAPRTKFKPKPPTYPEHIENQKKHSTSSDISSLGRDDSNYNLKNMSFDSTVPKRLPMKKHVSFQSDFCLDAPRSGASFKDQSVFSKYPPIGYSSRNVTDRHFDIDDDDNTTTTSGSYMVDFDNENTDYVHSRMRDVVV